MIPAWLDIRALLYLPSPISKVIGDHGAEYFYKVLEKREG